MASDRLKIADLKGVTLAFAVDATPQENETSAFVQMAIATALRRSSIEFTQAFGAYRKTDPIAQEISPGTEFPVDLLHIAPFRIQICEKNLLDHSWPVTPPPV
jgi:hypothetical protein